MRLRLSCLAAVVMAFTPVGRGQLPPGFVDETVAGGWEGAVGVAFAPPKSGLAHARMFVWERAGRVWIVENGVKQSTPLIDISEEVGSWGGYGLLGFAVDPGYWINGRIYLMYVVDYHHLKHFGTPAYDPQANTYNHDTIGRITRYAASASSNFSAVDYSSRVVLVGESMTTGFPCCHVSHGVGSLAFGADGTLLASCGDGASDDTDIGGPVPGSSNTALADGIITAKEDVGAYRSQLVDSLSGKVIRIDPRTGDGLPSNPFYDPARARSAASRVWALGFRQPFRMSVRPGTGSRDPADADPGSIYVVDVGWETWEELSVVTGPGQNFGWPLFEGLEANAFYQDAGIVNQDAPNPLAGGPCGPYFRFSDLCIQDTLAPAWPNPCDASQQVPASIPRFVHRRPVMDWKHPAGPSRTGIYSGNDAAVINIGAPGSPVTGPQFGGKSSTSGAWYTGTRYPAPYRNSYFFGEYRQGWMRRASFDGADRPTAVADFTPDSSTTFVAIAADPVSGDLHYVTYAAYDDGVYSSVHRISYPAGHNGPPTAVAAGAPTSGPALLPVQFTGGNSLDPEGLPLLYRWDFDDGTPPVFQADPYHVFGREEDVTGAGTITARVFSLDPPYPTGQGNDDPEVIRDSDYPVPGGSDPLRQFDTFHGGDQGSDDWIGYLFAESREFTAVFIQEGQHYPDGGWFDTLSVEVLVGSTWTPVSGLNSTPDYAGGGGPSFKSYEIRFVPRTGTGIRLRGDPGGASNFISVAELRVTAGLSGPAGPACHRVRLAVTDSAGAVDTAGLTITPANTPPQVTITSPANNALFSIRRPQEVPLTADVSDAEHPPGALACSWETIVHQGNQVRPPVFDDTCSSSVLPASPSPDCREFFYEFRVTVTDPACLATTRSVFMYPNCCVPDFNNDGFLDGIDYDQFNNAFEAGQASADYNGDGFVDGIDYDEFNNDFEAGC